MAINPAATPRQGCGRTKIHLTKILKNDTIKIRIHDTTTCTKIRTNIRQIQQKTYGDGTSSKPFKNNIYGVALGGSARVTYACDALGRLTHKSLNGAANYGTSYSYVAGAAAGTTATLLAELQNGSDTPFSYEYDANGNLTHVYRSSILFQKYDYDNLNQLAKFYNYETMEFYKYFYDGGGNITSVQKYGNANFTGSYTTKTYSYTNANWKDQLTSYDGAAITYDNIGNPLQYYGGITFSWVNGRQLATVSKSGTTVNYAYDDSGIRQSKTVNGTVTSFITSGSSILSQKKGSAYIDFLYDESGCAYGFNYQMGSNNGYYYYTRNGQGDIIGIVNSSGTVVVRYTYDAWGKLLTTSGTLAGTVGIDNPFRFKGYYYDAETGLYYCNSE